MEIPAELSRIIINETGDQQIIVIKEKNGSRSFPMVIGFNEVCAIDRRLKGLVPPRPLTHDLLGNTIAQLGGDIEKIVITDLREHTYFAEIYIVQNSESITIDSRPSDAIALGIATNTDIYVDDQVFEKAMQ